MNGISCGIREAASFRRRAAGRGGWAFLLAIAGVAAALTSCGPTYPMDKVKESVARVCRDEYKLDVKAEIIGKTIAIYLPLEDLIDFTFAITKSASEKINDVILSVSRVTLSTDAEFDFYCIIAHDIRIPEIQIVIIKSVDDVKRFLLNDISRGEYSKRMLVDIRLSPQAQKERAIKEIFSKMNMDRKWQEQVLDDFFRSEPASLGDIGYWNNRFYVKDVPLPEFLAEQIASRIRMDFREDKKLSDAFTLKSSKGAYIARAGKKAFRFEMIAEPRRLFDENASAREGLLFSETAGLINHVLRGYRFEDFDSVEITNQWDNRLMRLSRGEMEALRLKKIKFEELVKR
jgi:hypothetical protein